MKMPGKREKRRERGVSGEEGERSHYATKKERRREVREALLRQATLRWVVRELRA